MSQFRFNWLWPSNQTHTLIALAVVDPKEEQLNECRVEKVAGKCKLADFLSYWVVTRYEVSGWRLHPTELALVRSMATAMTTPTKAIKRSISTSPLCSWPLLTARIEAINAFDLSLPSYKSLTDWTATSRLWLTSSLDCVHLPNGPFSFSFHCSLLHCQQHS